MIGMLFSLVYAFTLWIRGYGLFDTYYWSTTLLYKYYFISFFVWLLFLVLMLIAGNLFFLASFRLYKRIEIILAWLGIGLHSGYSAVIFLFKRLLLIVGAVYLNKAWVFDEDALPVYRWDNGSLLTGLILLAIVFAFFTKRPKTKFKLRESTESSSGGPQKK